MKNHDVIHCKGIEILSSDESGYNILLSSGGWRVAVINYAERLRYDNFSRMERHMTSDEVFILLHGAASLIVGDEREVILMQARAAYNIKRNVWHAVTLDKDACVAVIENDDVSRCNTEYMYI